MPLYEFKCESCSQQFEELLSFSDKSIPDCPECESKKVSKLVSAGAVRTKGSSDFSSSIPAPSCSPSGG